MGRVQRVVVGGLAVAFVWAGAASAEHGPEGGGACSEHTTTCYPECRAEWGEQAAPVTTVVGAETFVYVPQVEGDYCGLGSESVAGVTVGGTPEVGLHVLAGLVGLLVGMRSARGWLE